MPRGRLGIMQSDPERSHVLYAEPDRRSRDGRSLRTVCGTELVRDAFKEAGFLADDRSLETREKVLKMDKRCDGRPDRKCSICQNVVASTTIAKDRTRMGYHRNFNTSSALSKADIPQSFSGDVRNEVDPEALAVRDRNSRRALGERTSQRYRQLDYLHACF